MFLYVDGSYLIGPIVPDHVTGLISKLIEQDSARSILLVRRSPSESVTRDEYGSCVDLAPGQYEVDDLVVEIVTV